MICSQGLDRSYQERERDFLNGNFCFDLTEPLAFGREFKPAQKTNEATGQ